jgi:sulfite exporter TauE/SafE
LAYLIIFGLGTALDMVLITMAKASTFSLGHKRFIRVGQHFGLAAGLISLDSEFL